MILTIFNTKKTFVAAGIILMLSSCQKFLDIKKSSSQSLIETSNDCQLILDNYSVMNLNYPSDGEVSADDYYLTSQSYQATNMTIADQDLYIWAPKAIRLLASPQWTPGYFGIYYSNLVLETVAKLRGKDNDAVLNDLKGQALFFRAYRHWCLAQVYSKQYVSSTASQDLGIPLRLTSDISVKSVRSTNEQVYNQITNDLKEATDLLNETSPIQSRPNKLCGYALLARIYNSMQEYAKALDYADIALNLNSELIDYNSVNKNSFTPFPRFNKEVIFQSVLAQNASLEPGSATNNRAKIDPLLLAQYEASDLRRDIFFKQNAGLDLGTYRFTGNYEPVTNSSLFNGLAVDELYLIRAECFARKGNIESSMNDLNALLIKRYKSGQFVTRTAANAEEALITVLKERRKELLMRGLRWADLKRLNLDSRFAKTLSRTVNGNAYSLLANDLSYTLLIPDEVIVNAKGSIVQNQR